MRGRGFTIVEAVVVVLVAILAVAVALLLLAPNSYHSRSYKDLTQVRGLQQALALFAQNSNDGYPVPSRLDRQNDTVAEEGRAKDTTANMFSCLVFSGSISTEMLLSPGECNPTVRSCEDYEFDSPAGAVDPARAIWDPKLSGVLDGSKTGHFSYAALQLQGDRCGRWASTRSASEVVIALRGPKVSGVEQHRSGAVTPTLASPMSNTLRFYGRGGEWSGPMVYNDGHAEFRWGGLADGRRVSTASFARYTDAAGKKRADSWCYDEPDDPKGANDYLGIFLKAGETPAEWKAAWD